MYIKKFDKNNIDYILSFAQVFITILIIYFLWYVQAFGNVLIILYGCTILSVISIVIHTILKGGIYGSDLPIGIWMPFILSIYLFFTSMLVAVYKSYALSSTFTYIAFNMLCLVIAYISIEKGSIEWLINVLIINTLLCCFWITFYGVHKPGYGKVLGINNNPNTLGATMVLGIFALAYKASYNFNNILLYLIISFWDMYVIISSGSRKSLLAACIMFAFWVLTILHHTLSLEDLSQKTGIIIAFFIIGLFAIYYLIHIYLNADMSERMSHFTNETSNTYRMYLYRRALELFLENPLFGVGINQFQFYSIDNHMAHSTYAEVIADFGFIGSIIYSIPIIQVIILAIKNFFTSAFDYRCCLVFSFICTELFFAVGQVFFYQPEHFIAWTIIYCFFHLKNSNYENYNDHKHIKLLKYIKN